MEKILCHTCKKLILKKEDLATDLHWFKVKPYHYKNCWTTYGFHEIRPFYAGLRPYFLLQLNTGLATFFAIFSGIIGFFFLGLVVFSLFLSILLILKFDINLYLVFFLFGLLNLHYSIARLYSYLVYEKHFKK